MSERKTDPLEDNGSDLAAERERLEGRYMLAVISGPDAGRQLAMSRACVIGSDKDCDLVLLDSTVSRRHLELSPSPRGVGVRDLGSTNGTFISGVRVHEGLLTWGADILVGKTVLRVTRNTADAPHSSRRAFGKALGRSLAMRRLFSRLERVAATDSAVLLMGETGTGKGLLAEMLHQHSARCSHPFVTLTCGSLTLELAESELFGHVRGAFTGATRDSEGTLARADGGTLFLDEVSDLSLELQPKLLRLLETRDYLPVGASQPRQLSARIIASTQKDLAEEVRHGRFREDLYFRLAVVVLEVPPLRQRPEDIAPLARHFIDELGLTGFALSPELLSRLSAQSWPGNLRELRNFIQRATTGSDTVLPAFESEALLPVIALASGLNSLPYREAKERLLDSFTREYLLALVKRCGGNLTEAAKRAGMARSHLYELAERYGIARPE